MPEDRSSSTPPPDDATTPPASSGGGFKAWLPLLVTILLMPVLAFGVTQYVILPQLQKGLNLPASTGASGGGGGSKTKADAAKEKAVSVSMTKLLVNVAGSMGARYLLVSLSIVGPGPDLKTKIDDHDAQLRDMANGVLGSKSLADLEKPGERNLIRNELIAGFNNILGDATVQEIYFPEFAIQ